MNDPGHVIAALSSSAAPWLRGSEGDAVHSRHALEEDVSPKELNSASTASNAKEYQPIFQIDGHGVHPPR